MRRRDVIALLGGAPAICPLAARVQAANKFFRIGWLSNAALTNSSAFAYWDTFRLELQRLGGNEGRRVVFEHRSADGVGERFPALARDLVESGVDLLVTTAGAGASAAKDATKTIPIVFG